MFPPINVQFEALLFPTLAQGSLLLSLLAGPNSLCTRKGFLPSPGLPLEEGWECMAGLTPPWPRPWWGQLVEVSSCWRVLQAGSHMTVTAWRPVLCVTQLFDKRAIVLPSKGMSHHSAWLGVPPERAGVGKSGETLCLKHGRVFPSLG